jgi:nitrogen regulatory protein PII
MAERQKLQPVPSGATFAPNRLALLVTIVQKGKGTFFADFLQTFDANLQISVVGTGTAQSDLVEFLGLKDNKRSVIFSVVREDRVDKIFEALQERFQTVNNGTGISFTIPLTSVIGKLSYGFLSNERRVVKGDE